MAFERFGDDSIDYETTQYDASRLVFRGPAKSLDDPYIAICGGTETYGKFLESPYPETLSEMLNSPVANFGVMNAGIDLVACDEGLLAMCRAASVTVIQITGAQNISNQFYNVHLRRNDRFLTWTAELAQMFRGVDFSEIHFTRHLLHALLADNPGNFAIVKSELQAAWVNRMKCTLKDIGGTIVLLWMADHRPGENPFDFPIGKDPVFVDMPMIEELKPFVTDTVVFSALPEEIQSGLDRMIFGQIEEPAAREMLGPIAHEAVASQLAKILGGI